MQIFLPTVNDIVTHSSLAICDLFNNSKFNNSVFNSSIFLHRIVHTVNKTQKTKLVLAFLTDETTLKTNKNIYF